MCRKAQMMKAKVICPFMGRPCKECAEYRGRHYQLCFWRAYRGHVEGPPPEAPSKERDWREELKALVELPRSPKWLSLQGFVEMQERSRG